MLRREQFVGKKEKKQKEKKKGLGTLSSWAHGEVTSQNLANITFAWAVTDCGRSRSWPAAWVRHCVAMKMDSWRSCGREDREWY